MNPYEIIQTVAFPLTKEGGNPCPVVLNHKELSNEKMQGLAKQLGFETCFVGPSELKECTFRFRYFVPNHEMEMCVHATISGVTVLVQQELITESPVFIETKLGPIEVKWSKVDGEVEVQVFQFLPQFKNNIPTIEKVCRALNIEASDLGEGQVAAISTSRYKLMVPLKSKEVLNSLSPNYSYLWDVCDEYEITGFYPFAIESLNNHVQARQFPNKAGYNEDAATGVAASGLGVYLYVNQIFPVQENGWHKYKIKQGIAMNRPSYIESDILVDNQEIIRTSITGKAIVLNKCN